MQSNDPTLALLTGAPQELPSHSEESTSNRLSEETISTPERDAMTIENLADEPRIELVVDDYDQLIENIDDVSSIFYLRERLQQMGAMFSPSGELKVYGHPSPRSEFEQMLRLGPMYAEQWNMFFLNGQTTDSDNTAEMWPDLRTLKKMLISEGLTFGPAHVRLTYGTSEGKMRRLGDTYDELRKQWLAMMALRLPAYDCEELAIPSGGSSDSDSGSLVSTDEDMHEVGTDISRTFDIASCVHRSRNSGVPRNIGWRFSDDIDPGSVSSTLKDRKDENPDGTGGDPSENLEIASPSTQALNRSSI